MAPQQLLACPPEYIAMFPFACTGCIPKGLQKHAGNFSISTFAAPATVTDSAAAAVETAAPRRHT